MRLAFILLLVLPFTANAQKKSATLAAERKEYADSIRHFQKALREATDEYKSSLKQLIALYEQNLERSKERLKKSQELFEANLISGREVESDKARIPEAEKKLADAKLKLEHADDHLKDLEDPDELARRLITQPAKRERTPAGRVYFVRFIVIGEVFIYDYSGAVKGRVIKQGDRVRYDSRKR